MKNNLDDLTCRIVHSDATTEENQGQTRLYLGSERWMKPPETESITATPARPRANYILLPPTVTTGSMGLRYRAE